MPDLNLSEDESAESTESTEPSSEQTEEQPQEEKKGGGLVKVLIVVLAVLIVGGGAAFLLNRLGIIKLWGTKQPAPTVVEYQEAAPAENATQEQAVEKKDAAPTQMIETPAIDTPKKTPAKADTKPEKKPAQPIKEMPATQSSGKLTEMKGQYTIQVFALKNKTSAESMVQKLDDAGYPVYLEEREYKDGPWYTVRIGHYPSRKDAQMAVESFAEELKSRYWIDRVKK